MSASHHCPCITITPRVICGAPAIGRIAETAAPLVLPRCIPSSLRRVAGTAWAQPALLVRRTAIALIVVILLTSSVTAFRTSTMELPAFSMSGAGSINAAFSPMHALMQEPDGAEADAVDAEAARILAALETDQSLSTSVSPD